MSASKVGKSGTKIGKAKPAKSKSSAIREDQQIGGAIKELTLPTVDEATAKLASFFKKNPYSTVASADKDTSSLQISKPWGDSSIAIIIFDKFDEVAEVLNSVVLPERLTALYHPDIRKIEVVWTAYKLPANQQEIFGRTFAFNYGGLIHECEFGRSSEKLLTIAAFVVPQTVSVTNHRNLLSFRALVSSRSRGQESVSLDEARSFWITNVDWDETKVIDMIDHLNFFLRYYDGLCPTVVIHPPLIEATVPKRTRYIKDGFPAKIDGRKLDENLLSFWSYADEGNPMLRFLLYYRILEYAAAHHIEANIREQLRKLIISPDLRHDLTQSVEQIVGAMSATKLADSQRLQSLMRQVDSKLLWRDVNSNIAFFSKDTCFEGGYTMKAIVGSQETEANFCARGPSNLADAFRNIRNALTHGKDLESSGVIRPTLPNIEKFRPWVHLIATAAGEVVLYKDAT